MQIIYYASPLSDEDLQLIKETYEEFELHPARVDFELICNHSLITKEHKDDAQGVCILCKQTLIV